MTTFDQEVEDGMWPPPMRRGRKRTALTWDRALLDRAADRLADLVDADAPGEDPAAAEQRALEAVARGAPASARKRATAASTPHPAVHSGYLATLQEKAKRRQTEKVVCRRKGQSAGELDD